MVALVAAPCTHTALAPVAVATKVAMVYSRGCCHAMSAVSAAMPCPWVPGATVLSVAAATRAARRRTLTVVAVVVAAVAVTAVSAAMPCPCVACRAPGTGVASVGHGVVLASTSDAAVIVSKLPVGTTESLAAGNVGRGLVPGAAVRRPLPVAAGATGETCACGAGAVFVIAAQGRRRRNDRDAAAAAASDVVDGGAAVRAAPAAAVCRMGVVTGGGTFEGACPALVVTP